MQEEIYGDQSKVLREKVRIMLCKIESELDQLEFIDVLQRIGVSYHFNNEIRDILDNIYNKQTSKLKKNLHATALKFRLLRQHGYDISTGYFFIFLFWNRKICYKHSIKASIVKPGFTYFQIIRPLFPENRMVS